jgi:hypothetical protein
MTALVDENFAGAAGPLVTGRTPSITTGGMSWTNVYSILQLDGAGTAIATLNSGNAAVSSAAASLGDSVGTVNYGLPSSGRITVSVSWGTSVAVSVGGIATVGANITMHIDGNSSFVYVGGNNGVGAIVLMVQGPTGTSQYLPVTVTANLQFDIVIDFTPTSLTATALGSTVSCFFPASSTPLGLNNIRITAAYRYNGGVGYRRILVEGLAFVPWWQNYLLVVES